MVLPRRFLRVCIAALSCFALSLAAAPRASAEIDPTPRSFWGVDGRVTGTTTDLIETSVMAIEQIGNRIYVGGKFLEVAHEDNRFPRSFLAAFDSSTGVWIDTWTPDLDGAVYALEASSDGSRLFVGGEFATVNGVNNKGLIALDPITGATDWTWKARVSGGSPAVVRGLNLDGDHLYVAGSFLRISTDGVGVDLTRVGRVSQTTAVVDPTWTPDVVGGGVWAVTPSDNYDRVYLSGAFTSVNSDPDTAIVATVSSVDGLAIPGIPAFPTGDGFRSFDTEVGGGNVFLSGRMNNTLEVYDEATLTLQKTHNTDGDYQDLEVVGDRLYASCHCFQYHDEDGVVTDVDYLIAYDIATGEKIPTFIPEIGAVGGPFAIHGAGDGCLWSGGDLMAVAGKPVNMFVRMCDPATLDSERPSKPTGFASTTVTDTTIDLGWNPSTDNVGVVRYDIFDPATFAVVASSTTPSVTITGLAADTDHSFFVRAIDAAENRSWRTGIVTTRTTGGVIPDTTRPSKPSGLSVGAVADTTVDLSWNASTDDVGVVGYDVYDAATFSVVASSTTLNVAVSGLSADTDYSFFVRARDAAGNLSWRTGSKSARTTGGVPIDTTRPSVPTGLSAVAVADTTMDLSWNLSTDDVGVIAYDVYDAATFTVVGTSPSPQITLTGLSPQTSYSFFLRARDAAGNLSWRTGSLTKQTSAPVGLDVSRPSSPSGLTVGVVDDSTAALSWNASVDDVAVTDYLVYDDATGTVVQTTSALSTVLTGLAPSSTTTYYVKATDAAGNVSWRSNSRTVTTSAGGVVDAERPSKPLGLMVTSVGASSADLSWTASTDNIAVTEYRVFDAATNTVIATIPAPNTTATVSGLTPGTTYTLYVKAADAANNTSWRSNTKTTTTP